MEIVRRRSANGGRRRPHRQWYVRVSGVGVESIPEVVLDDGAGENFLPFESLRLDRHHFVAITCKRGRSDETVGFKDQTDWTTVPSGMKLGWLA